MVSVLCKTLQYISGPFSIRPLSFDESRRLTRTELPYLLDRERGEW